MTFDGSCRLIEVLILQGAWSVVQQVSAMFGATQGGSSRRIPIRSSRSGPQRDHWGTYTRRPHAEVSGSDAIKARRKMPNLSVI